MVNTFLPFASIEASVRCLDNKRLGKQRVEAYQIWRILVGAAQGRGWQAHPATRAWEGHADALAGYTNACIDEWLRRGFRNTMQRLPAPPRQKNKKKSRRARASVSGREADEPEDAEPARESGVATPTARASGAQRRST